MRLLLGGGSHSAQVPGKAQKHCHKCWSPLCRQEDLGPAARGSQRGARPIFPSLFSLQPSVLNWDPSTLPPGELSFCPLSLACLTDLGQWVWGLRRLGPCLHCWSTTEGAYGQRSCVRPSYVLVWAIRRRVFWSSAVMT